MLTAAALHRYAAGPGAPVLTHPSPFGRLAYLTRRHAAYVGLLQDVTPEARALGFGYPVAITAGALADAVAWTDADTQRQRPQTEAGRLADVLAALANAAGTARGSIVRFTVTRIPRDGRSGRASPVTLRAECDYTAAGAPRITITTIAED